MSTSTNAPPVGGLDRDEDAGVPVALVHTVTVSPRDGVRLLLARCPGDRHDVCHGGGKIAEPIVLCARSSHCSCVDFYVLQITTSAEATT